MERVGFLLLYAKAIHNGIDVRASAKLWIVSASRAVLPLITTITTWNIAVSNNPARDILRVLIPLAVESVLFVLIFLLSLN
jgi:hypothetical protein